MSVRVGKTSARLGKWHIQNDAGEKVGGSVRNWADLRWDPAAGHRRIVQEEIGEQLAPIITLAQELGEGSFGRVFACDIRMPNQGIERHVIKLPRKLFQAGVLRIDPTTRELITTANDAALTQKLRADFQHEFENFEKLFEGQNYFSQFGGGRRGQVESADHWEGLQREMGRLNMHEGRKYLHEYLHFDAAIPAIVSSYCFNTLENVRAQQQELFQVDILNGMTVVPSVALRRVARELALAVDYIHSRGYVHTDIKPANVLVVLNEPGDTRLTSTNFTCKLSDFGEIMENKPTTVMTTGYTPFYTPPEWPERAPLLEPATFAIYGVAATVAALLFFPRYRSINWPMYVGTHFKQDMERLRNYGSPGPAQMGRLLFPAISDDIYRKGTYTRMNATWEPIAKILQLDYRLECSRKRSELLRNVIRSTDKVAAYTTRKRLADIGPPETLFSTTPFASSTFPQPEDDNDELTGYASRLADAMAMPPPFSRRPRPRPTPPGEYVAPPPIPPY